MALGLHGREIMDGQEDWTKVENVERGLRETLFGPQKGQAPMNRHCSGYRLTCPVLNDEREICGSWVVVTLAGDRRDGSVWIEDYFPECEHDLDDLSPAEQEQMLQRAIEESAWKAEDQMESRFDTREDRDWFNRDMRGE